MYSTICINVTLFEGNDVCLVYVHTQNVFISPWVFLLIHRCSCYSGYRPQSEQFLLDLLSTKYVLSMKTNVQSVYIVSSFLNVFLQCFEHDKQSLLHHHCAGGAAEISNKSQTICMARYYLEVKYCFGGIWVNQPFKLNCNVAQSFMIYFAVRSEVHL